MPGKTLFSGTVDVHYAFINVHDADADIEDEAEDRLEYRGQTNGLCGAARSGVLNLVTGLHTGAVGFAVELHPSEPAVSNKWEDLVEVSFTNTVTTLGLHSFESQEVFDLDPGQYRVRYGARGMDAGQDQDTLDGDEPVDFYLLQFWPAGPAPDRIIREHSRAAASWHHSNAGRALPEQEQQERARQDAARQQAEDHA